PRKGAKKWPKKTRSGQVKKGGWGKKASAAEVTVECGASEWLSSVRPRKTPYVPQIGDEVVYFRQGHELYVEAVRQKNLYQIDENTLPSNKCQVKELCKITSIQIEIKPPRLVCLKLNVLEAHTGHLTGQKLTLKYHDMAGVADFVILRQHYENSLQKKWQPMDSFRSYIDDSWYYGTIEAHKPFHDQYPHSEFQCFSIVWDSGDQDALSPWDLDEVDARGDGGEDASACVLYEPSAHEWHGLDRDSQCDRILSGIEIIREL
ncbi:bromodomain and WD repeat-containing 1 isoform X1, partial [Brachionus plicatilis]